LLAAQSICITAKYSAHTHSIFQNLLTFQWLTNLYRKARLDALFTPIRQVSPDCKWPSGRPSHTWLCAIEADFGPLNFGLATAWRKATTRDKWCHILDTAALQWRTLRKKEETDYAVHYSLIMMKT